MCYGISLYFPLKFNKSEVADYISFCPVEKYAELLDILYMQVPDVPLEFVNKGSLNEAGHIEVQLTEDSAVYLKEVSGKIWKLRKRDNNYIMLGTQTIDISEIHDMKFTIPFTGEWYYLGGQRLQADVTVRNGIKKLTATVEVNGEFMDYCTTYMPGEDGAPVFETGLVGSQYDEKRSAPAGKYLPSAEKRRYGHGCLK